ncbi:Rep [Chicken proventriculitis-associated circular virus 30]|nr:Rep [Chicken proventriculitis-associated circular virus 30]
MTTRVSPPTKKAKPSAQKTPPPKSTTQSTSTRTSTTVTTSGAATKELPQGEERPQKPTNWRLQAKNLYLTYPQCHTTKEALLQNSIKKFGEALKWIVISEEEHLDGTPHLHVSLALSTMYASRVPTDLDCLVESSSHPQGKHGNYQATRGIKKNLEYVTKKGKYLTHGDIDLAAIMAKKGSVYQPIIEELMNGKTPDEIFKAYPLEYFSKRKEIEGFHHTYLRVRGESQKPKLKAVNLRGPSCPVLQQLHNWLKQNLVMLDIAKRTPRMKHLYLCGPPGMGKSHLLNQLRDKLRVYDCPAEQWNDSYADGIYDLIVFDEFQGHKAINQMNTITDGYPTPLIRRGTHPYLKQDKLPVIICANKLPQDTYHQTRDRAYVEAFASRYLILNFYEAGFEGQLNFEFESVSNDAVILESDDEGGDDEGGADVGVSEEEQPLGEKAEYAMLNNLKRKYNIIDIPMDSDSE